MDDILEEIKGYVEIIDDSIEDNDKLDFVIDYVVDRFLAYTGRDQLVVQYEEDLEDDTVEEEDYEIPVPSSIRKSLAMIVVKSYKEVDGGVDTQTGSISSMSDNGQSVTYNNDIIGYLGSKGDSEIFSSVRILVDKFRIPTIVENT